MRVAVVHHHLRRGGVTRVIENAVAATGGSDTDVVVFTGEPPPTGDLTDATTHVIPGLKYADDLSVPWAASSLVAAMRQAAWDTLGELPDVWHFHNHSLGKNPAVTEAASLLAQAGERLLLQIHDFAEDGRPDNYRQLNESLGQADADGLRRKLYPLATHVHYATLNGRDRGFLASAGVPKENLHLLPNPAHLPEGDASDVLDVDAKLILYPTRAIRRKNIGEFILWSAAAAPDERFAVTMAPENPTARPVYDRWLAFAASHELPVEFEFGMRHPVSFLSVLRAAHMVATTSVAEGFGLAYLEPWLVDRPLCGRDLPDITADFATANLDLSGLYRRMDVPLEWVGLHDLRKHIEAGLTRSREAYGRRTGPADVDTALSAAVQDGAVDFGRLDETLQERAIERARGTRTFLAALRRRVFGSFGDRVSCCAQNRGAVETVFGLPGYGRRLLGVYQTVAESDVGETDRLAGEVLLDMFLDPTRFCLLRT